MANRRRVPQAVLVVLLACFEMPAYPQDDEYPGMYGDEQESQFRFPKTRAEEDEEQWGALRQRPPEPVTPGGVISVTTLSASRKSIQLYEKARKRLEKNRLDEAEKLLRSAVEDSPDFASAWHGLGVLCRILGRRDEARAAYQHAVESDPSFWKPYAQLVDMAAEEQSWPEVLTLSEQATRMASWPDAGVYVYQGIANLALGRWSAAEASARHAIRVDPEQLWPKAHQVLGLALYRQDRWTECEECLRRYLDMVRDKDEREERIVTLQLSELAEESAQAAR